MNFFGSSISNHESRVITESQKKLIYPYILPYLADANDDSGDDDKGNAPTNVMRRHDH